MILIIVLSCGTPAERVGGTGRKAAVVPGVIVQEGERAGCTVRITIASVNG